VLQLVRAGANPVVPSEAEFETGLRGGIIKGKVGEEGRERGEPMIGCVALSRRPLSNERPPPSMPSNEVVDAEVDVGKKGSGFTRVHTVGKQSTEREGHTRGYTTSTNEQSGYTEGGYTRGYTANVHNLEKEAEMTIEDEDNEVNSKP